MKKKTNISVTYTLYFIYRLDKYMSSLDNLKSNKRIINVIKSEQLSQFYFLVGLMLNRVSAHEPQSFANDKVKMSAILCFLKSSLISKPNTVMSEQESSASQIDANVGKDLLKFVQRESALRYSIIGNWFLFVARSYFNDDQIELLEAINSFSAQNNVCPLFLVTLFIATYLTHLHFR